MTIHTLAGGEYAAELVRAGAARRRPTWSSCRGRPRGVATARTARLRRCSRPRPPTIPDEAVEVVIRWLASPATESAEAAATDWRPRGLEPPAKRGRMHCTMVSRDPAMTNTCSLLVALAARRRPRRRRRHGRRAVVAAAEGPDVPRLRRVRGPRPGHAPASTRPPTTSPPRSRPPASRARCPTASYFQPFAIRGSPRTGPGRRHRPSPATRRHAATSDAQRRLPAARPVRVRARPTRRSCSSATASRAENRALRRLRRPRRGRQGRADDPQDAALRRREAAVRRRPDGPVSRSPRWRPRSPTPRSTRPPPS